VNPVAGDSAAAPFRADTYGESFAEVYDQWYGEVSDAEAAARFVAARCQGGPVLELGVGTGRLAQPLLANGVSVIGLDASEAMLSRCAARSLGPALYLVRADMAALPFRGLFGAVLIGFNTLFNLATEAHQRALFQELGPLLAPTGVLVVEANDTGVLAGLVDQSRGPRWSIGVRSADAQQLTVVATVVDPATQTITGQHVELSATGVRFRPWRLRWATRAQIDDYAAAAGLELAERYTGWDEAVSPTDTHVSVYRPIGQQLLPHS
jgi:SAM-dependent methyltransferase